LSDTIASSRASYQAEFRINGAAFSASEGRRGSLAAMTLSTKSLGLSSPSDVEYTAGAIAAGAVVGHA
jgi:hypothetical protein